MFAEIGEHGFGCNSWGPLDVCFNKPSFKKPPKELMCQWIGEAWCYIQQEMVIRSFLKCGITNASEDDCVFDSSLDDGFWGTVNNHKIIAHFETVVLYTGKYGIEKTFTAIYWLAKQEISNKKLLPLIDLIEYLGVKELKFFEYRSCPSIPEMFLMIGQTLRELLSAHVRKGNAYGILADKACDISVVEQLIVLWSF